MRRLVNILDAQASDVPDVRWRSPRHLVGMVAECLGLVADRLNIEVAVNDETLALMKAFGEGTIWPSAENLRNLYKRTTRTSDEIEVAVARGGRRWETFLNGYGSNLQCALEAFGIEVGVDALGGERRRGFGGAETTRDAVLKYTAGIVGQNPVALVCARWMIRSLSQDRPLDDDARDAAIAAWMAGEFEVVADLVCVCDELRKRFDANIAEFRGDVS